MVIMILIIIIHFKNIKRVLSECCINVAVCLSGQQILMLSSHATGSIEDSVGELLECELALCPTSSSISVSLHLL